MMIEEKLLKRCSKCRYLIMVERLRTVVFEDWNYDLLPLAAHTCCKRPETESPPEIDQQKIPTQLSVCHSLLRFKDEMLEKGTSFRVDSTTLYGAFCDFWRQNSPAGKVPPSICAFGRGLRSLVTVWKFEGLQRLKSEGRTMYQGYRLRPVPSTISSDQQSNAAES
jgi:hypothetical protein